MQDLYQTCRDHILVLVGYWFVHGYISFWDLGHIVQS